MNQMNLNLSNQKTNAIITGICFITATVTAIIGLKLYDPIIYETDFLAAVAKNSDQVVLGAVFELILACANIGTGIMLFPHLRRVNESLGLGYALFRLLEVVFILIGVVSMLSIMSLSHQYMSQAGDAASLQTSAGILKTIHGWSFVLGPHFMLGVNTFIYSSLFYRSELVPRRLALLGMAGAVLIFTASILEMFSIVPTFSVYLILMALPIAVYEMVLAGWLIVKGFNYEASTVSHKLQTATWPTVKESIRV